MRQEMTGYSGISWIVCKQCAPRSRQITTPPQYSIFYRLHVLPDAQPTVSKQPTKFTCTHTHLMALCLGLPRVSQYQKGKKPIWILLKQDTVSGSGISWAICQSASRSWQITTPAPHLSVFYRPDALPDAQPTASEHWRHLSTETCKICTNW